MSRIKVLNIYEIGIDAPIVCGQCEGRYCVEGCPENALTLGNLGQVVFSPTRCGQCGVCETSCPIGAIEINDEIVYVCDLCGGDPKCIQACTEDAISWMQDDTAPISLADLKDRAKKLNPSERRYLHAISQAATLREDWTRA
jgi:Fe-S-cluster-containing hydrogenase component 2